MHKSLILASASPRRRELLSQLGYEFTILISDIEEVRAAGETPAQYVQRLAESKAKTVLQQARSESSANPIVIGADTIVTQGERVFEKPSSLQEGNRRFQCKMSRECKRESFVTNTSCPGAQRPVLRLCEPLNVRTCVQLELFNERESQAKIGDNLIAQ